METLESSRVCRLCGKQSGISINIFDKNENHVRKINAVLPIMVHEMDLLPKHMCHRCSYKLEEFHKFYVDCLKTDADLKSQLSWMRKETTKEEIGIPMVHIENVKIKVEPPEYDVYDLDPIVENVNYINSMSSVAFPVNGVQANGLHHEGITYATYTRCRCCCDKDQSRQDDYERSVSRCGRINGGNASSCTGKNNLFGRNNFHERTKQKCRPATETKDNSTSYDANDFLEATIVRTTEVPSRSTMVRNLRPRKGSVDYVGTKKKSPSSFNALGANRSKSAEVKPTIVPHGEFLATTRIKVEDTADFEGRNLRPRKRTVVYLETRKRTTDPGVGDQRSRNEGHKRHKLGNDNEQKLITPKVEKIFDEDRLKLAIKQELLSDTEAPDESPSGAQRLLKNRTKSAVGGLSKIASLPGNLLVDIKPDIADYSSSSLPRLRSGFHVIDKLKALANVTKNDLKTRKASLNRVPTVTYSPKYLRSHDRYLRNGKVKKFDFIEKSVRKVRRNLQYTGEKGAASCKNLMKAIKGPTTAKKLSSTIKLVDNNIKHYCENCSVSFMNKELFKLHACYH